MIDNTPILSRDYSRLIEAPGISQDEIDYEAKQILRGMSPIDLSDALFDTLPQIKMCAVEGMGLCELGKLVEDAITDYCQRIARRKLGA